MTRILYPSLTNPPETFQIAVPKFESTWHQPWSEPVRKSVIAVALIAASGLFAPPPPPPVNPPVPAYSWFSPLSEPVRTKTLTALQPFKSSFGAQQPSFAWFSALAEPTRLKLSLVGDFYAFSAGSVLPVTTVPAQTYPAFSGPIRIKTLPTALEAAPWTGQITPPIIPVQLYAAWSEPVRVKPPLVGHFYAFSAGSVIPVVTVPTQVFSPLSEPIRPVFSPAKYKGGTTAAVSLYVLDWFTPFSNPRQPPRLTPDFYAFSAGSVLPPPPAVPPQVYVAFAEPVRIKPGLIAALQPFRTSFGAQRLASPPLSWFAPLTEPVRIRLGLLASEQQFLSYLRFVPSPANFLEGWYNWLSEPVRTLRGLEPRLQQFLTIPNNTPIPPQVSLVLKVTETGIDIAEFGIYVYTPQPTPPSLQNANVSIVEIPAIKGGNVSIKG